MSNNKAAGAKETFRAAIPPKEGEVSVDTTYGQSPMSDDSSLSRSMDDPGQLSDKPHGLNLEKDLESAVGIEMV